MRKLFTILSLLVVLTMALAACGGGSSSAPVATDAPAGPVRENVLRVNTGTYPDVIDPQKSSFVNEIAHLNKFYMGLTTQNEKLETIPGAAESWKFNDDATELVFTLKPGMLYSDGSVLNAKRFEFAFRRNVDPATAGEYASITDEIVNAPEWRAGVADTCVAVVDGKAAVEAAQAAYDTAKAASDAATTDTALAEATTAAETALTAAQDASSAAVCSEEEIAAIAENLGAKASHADGADCVVNEETGNAYDDVACDTFTLTFSKPAPYFATIAGIWVGYPAKEENITEGGDIWWTSSKYQIGNGPFIWQSVEPFVKSAFVPNPNYVGAGIPSYNLEFSYITDSAVAFEAYKNDEFDIVPSAAEDLPVIDADPDLTAQHVTYAGSCTTTLKFSLHPTWNGQPNPFTDKKVREAFALAFNAEGWAQDVDGGLGSPTWSWIPPGYPGYNAESPLKYDVEAAKAALAESTFGGPDALNALGLKITFGDSPRNRARFEWTVANYKENLGVDLTLDPVDPTTFTALTKDPNTFPLISRQGWCADYPDQQNWLSVFWRSDVTFASRQGYANAEFDKLVNAADVELDPAKRADLYDQAQMLMLSDIPAAFGYNSLNHYLVKPWVTGYMTTPQDGTYPGDVTPWTITIDTMMP